MEQAAPAPDTEVQQLPPARLTLTAPETAVMQFTETTLRAFAGQEITIDFANLHSELHNAVFLKADTDVPVFGQALDQYMTDPNSVDTEYIPPARQGDVLGSTGVIEQHQSASFTLGPLEEGVYPFLCTVPGALGYNAGRVCTLRARLTCRATMPAGRGLEAIRRPAALCTWPAA